MSFIFFKLNNKAAINQLDNTPIFKKCKKNPDDVNKKKRVNSKKKKKRNSLPKIYKK